MNFIRNTVHFVLLQLKKWGRNITKNVLQQYPEQQFYDFKIELKLTKRNTQHSKPNYCIEQNVVLIQNEIIKKFFKGGLGRRIPN